MHDCDHASCRYWEKHPALFYGLIVFLGYIFVLQTPWAFLPLLVLLPHRRDCFAILIIFLAPSCLIYHFYAFPEPGSTVKGVFSIESIRHCERYQAGWIYSGVLKTDQGRLQCRIFSKAAQSPYFTYQLSGTITRRHAHGICFTVKAVSNWKVLNKRWSLALFRYHTRSAIKRFIERQITQQRAAHFLTGMVTGQLEDPLLQNEFKQLGLLHLMAISGLHFSLLALFFHMILRLIMPSKWEAACLICLLTTYVLGIGDTPSIVRAWSLHIVFLIGQLIEKRGSPLNSLGVALLFSLLYNPLACVHLSFQLSFLATAAILFFYAPCRQLLIIWIPQRSLKEALEHSLIWQHGYIILSLLREALAVTLAVHVALLPFLLFLFHTFPNSSFIYNLFFPFLASCALLFFLISLPLGHWAHVANGYYCDWILKITEHPPVILKSMQIGSFPDWLLAIFFTALLVAAIGAKIKESRDRFSITDHPIFNHL